MIKVIILDWGGVLIDDPIPGIIELCSRHLKTPQEELGRAFQKFRPDFEEGKISEDVFWERVCRELGVPKPNTESLWGDTFKSAYSEKKKIFSLASTLKRNGYKIGFLSNTEVPPMNYFHEKGYKIFDVTVFSCIEGTRKPERRIYEIALNRLGVGPEEAIFIDDKTENVRGAEKIGINGILFRSPEQLKKELASFGVKID